MRIQMVVAEKLVEAAVYLVRAGLGDHIDHGARVAAVFRVKRVGNNLELLDAVRRLFHGGQVGEEVVAVAAVYGIVVGAAAAAIDGDDAGFVRTIEEVVADLRLNSRLQLKQLIDVARVQGQLRRGALVDNGAKLRRGRINNRRRASDFDYIGRTAELQSNVNGKHLVEVQPDSLTDIFLESLQGEIDFVTADGHLNEDVFAVCAGLHLARGVSALADQLQRRRRDRPAAGVRHRAADAPAGALRVRERRR